MRFAFDDEHHALRDAVRAFLEKECTPDDVREAWVSPTGIGARRWRGLAEMGVVGALAPEPHGGLGLDEVSLVLALEEAGRAALPEPLGEVAGVAVPLLAEGAAAEAQEAWLGRIAAGDAVVAVGLPGDRLVAHAASADLVLLADGADLHAVTPDSVQTVAQEGFDRSRRLAAVSWRPTPATRVAADAAEALAAAADRRALARAATALGTARRLIEMATSYALEREQFAVPIGSFQAVKHQLASAAVGAEFAAPAVYRAAWSIATEQPGRSEHAAMARALATQAAHVAGRTALQIHGAIGYTDEHDLHLWLRGALDPAHALS